MSDRLVRIASFSTAGEANIAKAALEVEGIRACVDGESTASTMWHAGPTIAGVHISVFADQYEKAKAILAEAGYGFDDDDNPYDNDDEDDGYEDDEHADEYEDLEYSYATSDDEDEPDEVERQAHIRRAWFAAVIGVISCPLVFNAYSLYLIVDEGLLGSRKGVRGDWRITAALILDIVALGCIGLLMTSGLFRSAD